MTRAGTRRMFDPRRHAPATLRNRDPILAALQRLLPASGTILEIASGTGEHAVFFAAGLPGVVWQPSDPGAAERASIDAHAADAGLANLRPAMALDVTAPLLLYGPFRQAGVPTAPSNEAFDADLRRRDPAWGLRDLDAVTQAAKGFALEAVLPMPANNLITLFRRT